MARPSFTALNTPTAASLPSRVHADADVRALLSYSAAQTVHGPTTPNARDSSPAPEPLLTQSAA